MNNEDKEKIEILDSNDEIEVLDFSEDNKLSGEELKKENKVMFLVIGVLILFVLLLPVLLKIFSPSSTARYSSDVSEIEESKTVDGMLLVGQEDGSITVRKIQFYNFQKRNGNTIKFNYLPESQIEASSLKEIYIELYNSKKTIIYRERFNINNKLERKILSTYTMNVNEKIYSDSYYAKVTIITNDDFSIKDSTLTCTKSDKTKDYIIDSTIVYNISTNGLSSYSVNRQSAILNNEETDESLVSTKSLFDDEAKEMTDMEIDDLVYSDYSISYSIDLINDNLSKPLYNLGDTSWQIKLTSELNGFRCE